MPQNIYKCCVSVFDKYLHWPRVSVKEKEKTLQQDNRVSVKNLNM